MNNQEQLATVDGELCSKRQAFLQSSDSGMLEAKSVASLTGKCLSSPFSKSSFLHSTVPLEKVGFPDFLIPLSATESR